MPFEITAGGPDIPPGTYKGTLESVTIEQATVGFNGQPPDKYRLWSFLIDVDGTLVPISATSSMGTSPKTKSYAWLTALLGTAPQSGETIEDPIGKMVLITVSKGDNGFPKVQSLTAYVEPAQAQPGIPR
jgi:hypothetical protein